MQLNHAIIGAGLAGLACAQRLTAAGMSVRLFERGRAPGGRMATRRFEAAAFDHGAQYFTVRDAGFASLVQAAESTGAVGRWQPRWPGGEQESCELWVGTPGMSALPRHLAGGLDIELGISVTQLKRDAGGWTLLDDRGTAHGPFDGVSLAMPAPGAAALARGHTPLAEQVAGVTMAPCWAVMLALAQPLADVDDARWQADEVLPWFARNHSKPGRAGLESWVLHADADYSARLLQATPEQVQRDLTARLAHHLQRTLPEVVLADAHLWRHARVLQPLGTAALLDEGARLGFCGDWCLDARVEAAFLSGDALAQRWLG